MGKLLKRAASFSFKEKDQFILKYFITECTRYTIAGHKGQNPQIHLLDE